MTDNADSITIDTLDFVEKDFLLAEKGDDNVSSSLYDKIFLPHSRVPKELIGRFKDTRDVEKIITGEIPLYQTQISKPYWKTQERPFDTIDIDIYGAVCIADDRHLLDTLIANGTFIENASSYTLRQVAQGCGLKDVDWSTVPANRVDRKLLNRGYYYHISLAELCKATKRKNQKKTKQRFLAMFSRMSIMLLALRFKKEGKTLNDTNPVTFNLIDNEYYALFDRSKVNHENHASDTRTDIIVNVSEYYVDSLNSDGGISRRRMINHYPYLIGKNNIEDFYKHIDMHKRVFLNNKRLTQLISQYLDSKMSLFGMNRRDKAAKLFEQLASEKEKLQTHFNIKIEPMYDQNRRVFDYILHYEKDELTS